MVFWSHLHEIICEILHSKSDFIIQPIINQQRSCHCAKEVIYNIHNCCPFSLSCPPPPTGNYSRLSCEFFFVRSLGYYVIQIYVPSTLIVVLSWVSFWLSRDAVPARVALGITTVLTMTTLISSTNASLPKISYLKSIDVYLVTCFVMVFGSLIEYAVVSYLGKSE